MTAMPFESRVSPAGQAITRGQAVLNAARELAPKIAKRAEEIEAARGMPIHIVEDMRRIGIFRMFTPHAFGGLGLSTAETLPILEELSTADGSAGWVAMIGSHAPILLGGLPAAKLQQIYAGGPDVIGGGSVRSQQGTATQTAKGWRVKGQWSFASGCQHADWLIAWCTVLSDGVPATKPSGGPRIRLVALPAKEFRIIENWDTVGLRGTASHDIALDDILVPQDQTVELDVESMSGSFADTIAATTANYGAVAVGIAEGALREFVAMANTQRAHGPNSPLSQSILAQEALGESDADVSAARAYLFAQTAAFEQGQCTVVNVLQAAAWIVPVCIRAIERCYNLAGTASVRMSSPLQRRLRDIHTLSHHGLGARRNLIAAGSRRFGLDLHPFMIAA